MHADAAHPLVPSVAAPQLEAFELIVTQILKLVPWVKRGNKKAAQISSALELVAC